MKNRSFWLLLLLTALFLCVLTACGCSHEWTEPTCTEPAYCEKCGEENGSALGHGWMDATCEHPKTCRRCGKTKGEALEHEWNEATCTEPKTCALCGATEGEPLEHEWSSGSCIEPAVCAICGEEGDAAGEHSWQDATCEAPKTCSVCGAVEGEALGHTAGESELTAYDLVDAIGTFETCCTVCGAVISGEDIPMPSLHNGDCFFFSPADYTERLYNILERETDLTCELYVNESMDDIISCDMWSTVMSNEFFAYSMFYDGNNALKDTDSDSTLAFDEVWTILDCVSADDTMDATSVLLAMLLALDPALDEDAAADVVLDMTDDSYASCNGIDYTLEVADETTVQLLFTAIISK